MSQPSDLLAVAAGEIGYDRFADPDEGSKYGHWYAQDHGSYFGTTGVPYCAMFTSWCFAQVGVSCAGLPAASTRVIYDAAKAAGRLRGSVRDAQPGDVMLFDWKRAGTDGDGDPVNLSHTCICELNRGDDGVQTIEGNVSNGKVLRRVRDWSYVAAVVAPDWPTPTVEPTYSLSDITDPHWYYGRYGDVAWACADGARSHFETFGAGEGRRPSALYDHDWYRSHYSDLDAAFGDDVAAYAQHFVTFGIKEGRRASFEFDPAYYRSAYSDLDAAFGDDWPRYYLHYLAYGIYEGRTTHDPAEDAQ